MKVAFYTLGCKVNQYETKAMRRLLEQQGYEVTFLAPNADGIVTAEQVGEALRLLQRHAVEAHRHGHPVPRPQREEAGAQGLRLQHQDFQEPRHGRAGAGAHSGQRH